MGKENKNKISADVIPTYLFGTVSKADEGGVSIDVKRDIDIPLPIDGNTGRSIDYMNVSGLGSSSWESSILGNFFSTPTVSAVKLLNAAYKQGIPIYTITSSNMDSILPKLSVDSSVISAIQDAINADDEVIISQTNIQYYDWNGVGYIVYDPSTGAGGYMISGGMLGAATAKPIPDNQDINVLYKRLCEQKRIIILNTAINLYGTPYLMGGKSPDSGLDCSGYVAYCYEQAGFTSLSGLDAQGQYNNTISTTYPFYMDLVFYIGFYDKNDDCYRNESDGVTHVGLALAWGSIGYMLAAQGRQVDVYPIYQKANEKNATAYNCNNTERCSCERKVNINNGLCPGSDDCYTWQSTGRIFTTFAGYRYAKEFDINPACK